MVQEKKALTDGVIADLLWKLRLRLEAEGHRDIDTQRLRKESSYREHWLALAAASSDSELNGLEKAIRNRLLELLNDDAPLAPSPADGNRKLAWLGVAALLLVAAGGLFFALGTPAPAPVAATPAASAPPPPSADKDQPAAPRDPRTLFRIHGSNTVGEELAPALVKDYLASRGGTEIVTKTTDVALETRIEALLDGEPVAVEIHAHGSSTAFADLAAGATDIGMSSRKIKGEEVAKLAPTLGDLSLGDAEHIIALDGLAVVVNPGLAIREMNVATVAAIFAGEIANWQQLGGPDLPIQLFARDDNSGTWDSFDTMVLKPSGKTLADAARRFESSQELSDGVAATPGAIGFIGLPYVRRAKLLAISGDDNTLALFPNNFTVSTEDYPLARRLYLYLSAQSSNMEARQFIDHVHASQGQGVVGDIGFISQNISATKPPVTDDLPYEYLQLTEQAERLSINVCFALGSDGIDNKAQRDLFRLASYLEANPGRRVLLLGFTDSVGSQDVNLRLSKTRAELVSKELMKLGIFPYKVEGFGALAPVAANDNDEGRQRNRRVEVWII